MTAWWISDRPRPALSPSLSPPKNETEFLSLSPFPFSLYYQVSSPPRPLPEPATLTSWITHYLNHPLWLSLSSDIFTGQIIASLVVLTFVAIFLLREWIAQNARPGVFDDDVPGAGVLDVPNPNPGQNPVRRQIDVNARLALAQRQFEALRALDAMRDGGLPPLANNHAHNDDRFAMLRARRRNPNPNAPNQLEEEERERHQVRQERIRRRNFARRLHAARMNNARRAPPPPPPVNGSPFDIPPEPTELEQTKGKDRSPVLPAASFFPDVQLQPPPSGSIPFSFTFSRPSSSAEVEGVPGPSYTGANFSPTGPIASSSGPSSSTSSPFPSLSTSPSTPPHYLRFSPSPSSNPFSSPPALKASSAPTTPLRRPPMPPSTTSPLASPSVSTPTATYRAPEDLGADEEYFSLRGGKGKARADPEPEDVKEEDSSTLSSDTESETTKIDVKEEDEEEQNATLTNVFAPAIEDVQQDVGDEEFKMYFRLEGEVPIGGQDDIAGDEEDTEESEEEEGEEERGNANGRRAIEAIMDVDASDEEHDDEDEHDEDDDDDHFIDDHDGDGERELRNNQLLQPVNPLLPNVNPANANLQPNPEDDDPFVLPEDLEPGVEDDMDGAMEAIGLRGPPWGVLQNAALLIFLLDLAIGLGVCLPYTIGKATALVSLNPRRVLYLAHLPIKAIRVITDPIVDVFILIVLGLSRRVLGLGLLIVRGVFGKDRAEKVRGVIGNVLEIGERALSFSLSSTETATALEPTQTPIPSSWLSEHVPWDTIEPYFAPLGSHLRESYASAKDTYVSFALNDGPYERVLSVILGYIVIGVVLGLYLRINVKNAGRAVRSAVRQQLLVVKVAIFIFIELVVFPFCCGVVLSMCSVLLGLLKEASFRGRIEFFREAPLTAVFWHWIGGTMFMYSFAVLLSGCRTIMRPGAMWFIKDPQDTNSHPIRDILDRPTFAQLRKIFVSGLMYSFVVACAVTSVAGLMYVSRWVLGGGKDSGVGLRWRNREPLSHVPVDLLFLHFVLPYTMSYFRPRKPLKKVALFIWRHLAAAFRLSSYFFGGRHAKEEYPSRTIFSFLPFLSRKPENENPMQHAYDGTFRRVPATDHNALPRDMRATVAVTATGEPIDEKERLLMLAQDAETLKAKRNIHEDYTVVYLPPAFRYRIIGFICCLWMVGAACVGLAIGTPVVLGRAVLSLFLGTGQEAHDGYAIIVGFYLLWGCYLVGKAVDRLDKRRQRTGTEGPRAHLAVLVVKRGALWLVKTAYMSVMLGVVVPTLVGLVLDFYLVLPLRLWSGYGQDGQEVKIRIVDEWALGLLYVKIGMKVMRGVRRGGPGDAQNQNTIGRGIVRIKHNGWTHPDPVLATKEVILPVIGGLLAMLLLPGITLRVLQFVLPVMKTVTDDRAMFIYVYPGIFLTAALGRSSIMLREVVASWSQAVRDKEFLVEMRLKNLEESEKGKEREKEVGLGA
ncbi:hypothetical protein VNI00_000525 [Paramarasmius palmivorus]|uniref:RING-type E3 ubiquitin transferase n=1 Tax=Paramarasmius palmivorus TaxID=297713 RepID=A0AAW0E9H5_9AGAR